jgi:hypothetical protein
MNQSAHAIHLPVSFVTIRIFPALRAVTRFAWPTLALLGLMVVQLIACGGPGLDGNTFGGDSTDAYGEVGGDGDGDGYGDGDGEPDAEGNSQAGQGSSHLTAGAWDDNLNYDFFESFLSDTENDMGFEISAEERADSAQLFSAEREPNTDLDIALVLDTTGSMGDELQYLIEEIGGIAAEIQDQLGANTSARWALVAYKDSGDDYLTQVTDFSSLTEFQNQLSTLSPSGGGDYPEASAEALRDASQLNWRSDTNVARLVFWVADAPHHTNDGNMLKEAILDSKNGDIRIYPVASSGVDLMTELSMRSAAQVTGGRYLFLTDDSGIGDSHLEPTIPCYFVTTLSDAMVRMVTMELSGTYIEPTVDQVIRAGGDPQDGRCTLEDGSEVQIL